MLDESSASLCPRPRPRLRCPRPGPHHPRPHRLLACPGPCRRQILLQIPRELRRGRPSALWRPRMMISTRAKRPNRPRHQPHPRSSGTFLFMTSALSSTPISALPFPFTLHPSISAQLQMEQLQDPLSPRSTHALPRHHRGRRNPHHPPLHRHLHRPRALHPPPSRPNLTLNLISITSALITPAMTLVSQSPDPLLTTLSSGSLIMSPMSTNGIPLASIFLVSTYQSLPDSSAFALISIISTRVL